MRIVYELRQQRVAYNPCMRFHGLTLSSLEAKHCHYLTKRSVILWYIIISNLDACPCAMLGFTCLFSLDITFLKMTKHSFSLPGVRGETGDCGTRG